MSVSWITQSGFLFTATEASVVNLSVSATGTDITYNIITGKVPTGLNFSNSGTISGTVTPVVFPTTSTFVVRASDLLGNIKDRTFSIFVPPEEGPTWETPVGFSQVGDKLRGFILSRDFVSIQFTAGPPLIHSDDYPIKYSVSSGNIPRGLKFQEDGKLVGAYMRQMIPGTYKDINFTVAAGDGYLTTLQPIEIIVIDADTFRADSTVITLSTGTSTIEIVDITLPGSSGLTFIQVPEFINGSDLGFVTANDKHYISVRAFDPDPDNGPVIYSLIPGGTSYQNPPENLNLDPATGYLYGRIPATTIFQSNYTFGVKAEKIDTTTGSSITATNTFTLGVYANDRFTIDWATPSNLGSIQQGEISELAISATTSEPDVELMYKLYPGSTLPNDLVLLSDGNIKGVSASTGTYTFIALAIAYDYTSIDNIHFPEAYSTQTFSITVTPELYYTSIYVEPLLSNKQQDLYDNFINDENIFVPNLMYRADDPNFGVRTDLRMFIEFGIEQVSLNTYSSALVTNFYKRRLTFGDIKVAIANDSQGKHLYDVVYVNIVDDIEGAKRAITINDKVYYPGSIDNMRNTLSSIQLNDYSTIGVDDNRLPKFMKTNQTTGGPAANYIKCVVLCYVLPGQGGKILARIRAANFDFKLINFEIDRIVIEKPQDSATPQYLLFPRSSITKDV